MKLYYLTSAQFALSNLALRRVKIFQFPESNDPFELMAVNLSDEKVYRTMGRFFEDFCHSKAALCFSAKWENPVLWGHYADKHKGIALGFEVAGKLLFEVKYADRKFDLLMDPKTDQVKIDESTIHEILSTKFSDWQYENEWRFFVELSEAKLESGLYFEEFSESLKLTEVILGAKCELPIEKVQSLINAMGLTAKVIKAKIARDEFKVIVDGSGPS